MNATQFALVSGIVYLAIGILGFVPGVLQPPPPGAPPLEVDAAYGYLLGLFPVNVIHSLVHLAVGVWGVFAYRALGTAWTYAASLAVLFGVLTIFGLVPGLSTVFGLVPLFGHDIWLHALTALVAAYFATRGRGEARIRERLRRAA